MITAQIDAIPGVGEATVRDFMLELLSRLNIEELDLEPAELDDIELFISQWAQSYWTADTVFEPEV